MGSTAEPQFGRALLKDFGLREGYVNLNHGSYGSLPNVVKSAVHRNHGAIESSPDHFFRFQYRPEMRKVRAQLAEMVNADADEISLVLNATTGVNMVLRSLDFGERGGILYFSTIYGSCGNAAEFVVDQSHGRVFSHEIPIKFPIEKSDILESFETALKSVDGIKVAVFDPIVSLPGVQMPWIEMVQLCKTYHVLSLVDGAHGIGHVALDLSKADPDFFVTNCHKWLFSMRATAMMYISKRVQPLVHSLPIGHGYISEKKKQNQTMLPKPVDPAAVMSAFELEFETVGTADFAAFLAIPDAIAYRESLGGEDKIITHNVELAQSGGLILAEALGTEIMSGPPICMINVRLPFDSAKDAKVMDPSARALWFFETCIGQHNLVFSPFLHDGKWWGRFCAQVYNEELDFKYCGEVLSALCQGIRDDYEGK